MTVHLRVRTDETAPFPAHMDGKSRRRHPFLRLVENAFAALGDARLISDITDGSHAAFAELVKRHSVRYFQLAWRYTRSREQAEDIVQEAFLKIWEAPHVYAPERGAAFTTWFARVVINMCLDAQRRRPFAALPDDEEMAEDPVQEEEISQAETQRALEAAIAELPARQQQAINLCYLDGISNREAAAVMDIHVKALESLLMRAKKTLQEKLCFLL